MDLDLLKNFCAVAKFKNMTKAAEYRNISPSAVSKKIAALEQTLGGVTLMQRFPSKLYLTEEGEIFLPIAERILNEFETSKALMKGPVEADYGPLKILAMASFGLFWFTEQVKHLRQRFPSLELDLSFDNLKSFAVASNNSGVYAGLATIEPRGDSTYIWKRLGSFYAYPYAHSRYLEVYGEPKTFKDLDRHKLLRQEYAPEFTYYIDDTKLNCLEYLGNDAETSRNVEVRIDSTVAIKAMIEAGMGIGMMPSYMAEGAELVQLFKGLYDPAQHSSTYNVYLVYPSYLKSFKRINLLKDFLLERLHLSEYFFDIPSS